VCKTKAIAHNQIGLFDYLMKEFETCKKNEVFVSSNIIPVNTAKDM
jgi:hypothetical protein